jgi:malate synthase
MEDAATAEISRAQIWQWVYHGVSLSNGEIVTMRLVNDYIKKIVATIKEETIDLRVSRIDDAAEILQDTALTSDFASFLTLDAYEMLELRHDMQEIR